MWHCPQPVQQATPDTSAEVAAVREALAAVSPAAQKAVASFLAEAGKSLSSLRQERNALALDSHQLLSLLVRTFRTDALNPEFP